MAYKRKKRTLSAEQLAKMKAGRERAAKARAEASKTKERVEALSDLDARLLAARREEPDKVKISGRRRRRRY